MGTSGWNLKNVEWNIQRVNVVKFMNATLQYNPQLDNCKL